MLRNVLLVAGVAYMLFGATMGDQAGAAEFYRDMVGALTIAIFVSPWLVEHIDG